MNRNYEKVEGSDREKLQIALLGAAVAAAAAFVFYRSLTAFLILCVPSVAAAWVWGCRKLRQKQDAQIAEQFLDALSMLGAHLSAGLSVENAFPESTRELEELHGSRAVMVQEFRQICREIRLNRPAAPLLADLGKRTGNRDIQTFALVFQAAGKNGGSLADILSETSEVLREKAAVSAEIANETASRRYEQRIMDVMPFAMVLYLNVTSPDYLTVLYESFAGRLIMTACLMLCAGAFLLSEKILEIRV